MDANKWLSDWLTAHGMPGVKHMRREDIVRALDAYAAERERSALERVAEFSSVPPTTIPDWLKPGDVGYAYLVGWRDAHTDYRRAIRALMSETPPGLEFDADYAAIIKQRLAADNKETTNE